MEATDFALLPRTSGGSEGPSEATLEKFLTFNDRQSYVEWRADWKEEYREMSARIRSLRTTWRAEGSDHDPALHYQLFATRGRARSMLALRKASKAKAEQLYQQSKVEAIAS